MQPFFALDFIADFVTFLTAHGAMSSKNPHRQYPADPIISPLLGGRRPSCQTKKMAAFLFKCGKWPKCLLRCKCMIFRVFVKQIRSPSEKLPE
jgi:hypothetical protein